MTLGIREKVLGFGLLVAALLLFAACGSSGGVAQETHDQLLADFEELQVEFDALQEANNELEKEAGVVGEAGGQGGGAADPPASQTGDEGRPNVATSFNPDIETPTVDPSAYIDPNASVIGNVILMGRVYVAPFASARGDEGQPIFVGQGSNLQDGVVLHALETVEGGLPVEANEIFVRGEQYAIYIGSNVSVAHQAHIHGPSFVGDETFIGMQALLFKAHVGSHVVVEPGALIMGVTIADWRYVPAGAVITTQADADALPMITEDYALKDLNEAVLHVNQQLADGYNGGGESSGESSGGGH